MNYRYSDDIKEPTIMGRELVVPSEEWEPWQTESVVAVSKAGEWSKFNNSIRAFAGWRFFADTEVLWEDIPPDIQLDIVKKVIEAVTPIFPDDVVPWTEEQYALVALENL